MTNYWAGLSFLCKDWRCLDYCRKKRNGHFRCLQMLRSIKNWGLMQELGKVKGERSPPIYWRLSHQSRNSHTQQATKPTPSNN